MKFLKFWASGVYALSSILSVAHAAPEPKPRPLVIWHGLGDSHSSPGMVEFQDLIKKIYPGIFIHSVYLDENLSNDRRDGFYGNVNSQIEFAADQIASIPELAGGFDAMGLSQGGQFLRAYVERYNTPPIHNLITFGSQHMGISDIPACKRFDFLCQAARRAVKGAVYSEWAQNNLVQAQYYRDPRNYETYLEANHFLPDINNERPDARNRTYAHNLASLNKLVLIVFTEDETVVPKESSWFGSEEITSESMPMTSNGQVIMGSQEDSKVIIPMRQQPLYKEDWIGLRALDEKGGVDFDACVGVHMHMGECWERVVRKYVGGK